MINPKHQRYVDLLVSLIDLTIELQSLFPIPKEIPLPVLVATSRDSRSGRSEPLRQNPANIREKTSKYEEWRVRVTNGLETIFGLDSPQWREWQRLVESRTSSRDRELVGVEGLLRGSLRDLEGGYLSRHEAFIAGEVLDSLLERAEMLRKDGHPDCAAVLCRVAIEDGLRRLGQQQGIDVTQSASALNDALWKEGLYTKPMWRQVQSALDTGNHAAHGETKKYTTADVESAIHIASSFLAGQFGSI